MVAGRLSAASAATPQTQADAAATALLEASEAPTLVLSADNARSASAAPAAPTAKTAVLGTPQASDDPRASDDAVAERAVAAAFQPAPKRSRRWLRPAIAVVLLAVIAIGVILLVHPVIVSLTQPQTAPTETLPSLPGELGVHLEQLEEAVTR
jgi:ferric-dicitrate binding protein FerR (iron transport regulator)